jgi:hypothetical protein
MVEHEYIRDGTVENDGWENSPQTAKKNSFHRGYKIVGAALAIPSIVIAFYSLFQYGRVELMSYQSLYDNSVYYSSKAKSSNALTRKHASIMLGLLRKEMKNELSNILKDTDGDGTLEQFLKDRHIDKVVNSNYQTRDALDYFKEIARAGDNNYSFDSKEATTISIYIANPFMFKEEKFTTKKTRERVRIIKKYANKK